MISLRAVSKTFGNTTALDSINLQLDTATTTVLLGTSGCGKSTILRLVCQLLIPDSGEIRIHNRPLTQLDIAAFRQRIGYVIQDGGLFPHMTARQNVILMAQHLHWPNTRIQHKLTELAELVRLPLELLSQYPSQLSGGQKQRVSIMRALMLDPELLLLDEPLGALDPITRSDLQQDLKAIFRELHKTVVFVTHDLGEASFLGDHIVLLRQGKIVQQGSINNLVKNPSDPFVTRFINAQRIAITAPENASGPSGSPI